MKNRRHPIDLIQNLHSNLCQSNPWTLAHFPGDSASEMWKKLEIFDFQNFKKLYHYDDLIIR